MQFFSAMNFQFLSIELHSQSHHPIALLVCECRLDSIDPDHLATFDLQESLALRSSVTTLVNIGENQEIVENEQWLVIVTEDSKELVIFREDALLSGIIMNASSDIMNYTLLK